MSIGFTTVDIFTFLITKNNEKFKPVNHTIISYFMDKAQYKY